MQMQVNINMEELEPRLQEAAKLMALLSQPVRLKVLCGLAEGERNVQDMADSCNLSQPAMSHHLAKLRAAGLVSTRRAGQTIFYSIAAREVKEVLAVLHDLYCSQPDTPQTVGLDEASKV